MTKARDIVKRISREAKRQGVPFELEREGGNHTVYRLGATRFPIPRHSEIREPVALAIYKQSEPELGKAWWR